ncbi:MAG: prepilin-type N-terminal cleavage/methylation domain-containing protein [Gammaproteobacteria bacterium]|nr:prepilin-type N-terminal cleavage/methylation domain-containing protein [Gammaproteobacteria bacterium]NNM14350.1 prepilin-type N-terminal cleavage/methylation domain-containing protein [Gammaproteobacteria bacterium]
MKKPRQNQMRKKQKGLTLIELLIAIAIGVFLLLAVTSIFNATRRSFDLQDNLAEMSEVARFSIDTINWHTRMAGYRETGFADGPLTDAITLENGNPDSLSLVYEADVDCNQVASGADGLATVVFTIENDSLMCNGQVMFENVVDMQIFVGLDTGSLRDGVVDKYVSSSIESEDEKTIVDGESDEATVAADDVRALNINLLIRSDSTTLSNVAPTLNNDFWSFTPGNDGRLYQEYSFNIAVRNNI